MFIRNLLAASLLLVGPGLSHSQDGTGEIIVVENGSFEDVARASLPPSGWIDCGFPDESPPDVQPSGAWGVFDTAHHGYTYLGMVTRENSTWEAVGQKLSSPLQRDHCYQFSLYLCRADVYLSAVVPDSIRDRSTPFELPKKNFDRPIKLQIWAGHDSCEKAVLLAESPLIDHDEWKRYHFICQLTEDVTYLVLVAFYNNEKVDPYNGNLLIDQLSNFQQVRCD